MNDITALAKRILPKHFEQIIFRKIDQSNGNDIYTIESQNDLILICGNNAISMAAGLGWYLKNIANCNIAHCGGNMELPQRLPKMNTQYKNEIEQKYRAYMNYCTINYSASWWKWERWEQEIDFMALNGINMPLSVVGIEGAWYYTLIEFGFTDEQARNFLCGPAFLAWQWMTNIEGFAGPLPRKWIDERIKLGKSIMERQLELGMTPIQQGFSGFVPLLLKEKYPDAHIQVKNDWCGLQGTAQLDPTDPLFLSLGTKFLEKEKELFGAHGFYAIDPFHECKPPIDTKEYLNGVGVAIKTLLTSFDKDGVWVAQSWSIRYDIISQIDKQHLLILDLAGQNHTKTTSFWGYPFITGTLHNFGGRINMHGDMKRLADNPYKTIQESAPNICGTGMFMEAIGQNPMFYDLAFEMLTQSERISLADWTTKYMRRRIGITSPEADEAGSILIRSVYIPGTNGVEKSSIICARPAICVKKSGPNDGLHYPYGNRRLLKALKLLVKADAKTDGYNYDIVDMLRQVLSNYGQRLQREVSERFLNRELNDFKQKSEQFIGLLADVDTLLSSRHEFRLDTWIDAARDWGDTDEEKQYYEWNAGLLITLWGNDDNAFIFDYAWKEWSGLINTFYKVRWSKFFDMLEKHLVNDTEYNEDDLTLLYQRESWRANDFYDKLADFEVDWTKSRKIFSSVKPNEREIVLSLIAKYEKLI